MPLLWLMQSIIQQGLKGWFTDLPVPSCASSCHQNVWGADRPLWGAAEWASADTRRQRNPKMQHSPKKRTHTHTQNKTREDHRLYRVAPPPSSQRHSFIFPFFFTSILVSPCLPPCFSVEFILSTESSDLYTNVCILDTHCSTHP